MRYQVWLSVRGYGTGWQVLLGRTMPRSATREVADAVTTDEGSDPGAGRSPVLEQALRVPLPAVPRTLMGLSVPTVTTQQPGCSVTGDSAGSDMRGLPRTAFTRGPGWQGWQGG